MMILNQFENINMNMNILITILSILTLLISFFINFNPLILSMLFIFFTMIVSFNLCLMQTSNFYSFIMFLSMISGLMVVFMYFASLNNNNKTILSLKKTFFILMTTLYLTLITLNLNKINFLKYLNHDLNYLNMNFKKIDSIEYMYNYTEIKIMMFMISYLLMSLICIIKICTVKSTPLRKFK